MSTQNALFEKAELSVSFPEDIVKAILHEVGQETRIADDVRLAAIFNRAAQEHPEFLGEFAWHPQYHDSELLEGILQVLDLGGSILRENAPTKYFRVSAHTAGPYGESKLDGFSENQKDIIRDIAKRICAEFSECE